MEQKQLRVAHAADCHLASSFGRFDAGLARRLQEAQIAKLHALLLHCDQEQIPILLLAGDVFDRLQVSLSELQSFQDMLASFPAIQMVIAPGNHDPYVPGSLWTTSFPSHVHVVREPFQRLDFPSLDLSVDATAFTSSIQKSSLLPGALLPDPRRAFRMLLMHGSLLGEHGQSDYHPINKERLEASGYDYAALGHQHRREEGGAGKTPWAYPGVLMGRGFDECGLTGFYLIDLYQKDGKKHIEQRFHPLPGPIFEKAKLSITELPGETQAAFNQGLVDAVKARYSAEKAGACLLSLQLEGQHRFRPQLSTIKAQLAGYFMALVLEDKSHPEISWGQYRDDWSVRGHLARLWERAQKDAHWAEGYDPLEGLSSVEQKKRLEEAMLRVHEALEGKVRSLED